MKLDRKLTKIGKIKMKLLTVCVIYFAPYFAPNDNN